MPKLTASQFFKKLILVTCGCFFTALGINLFIRTGLGADSVSMWVQGMVVVFGGDYGVMTLITNTCFFVMAIAFAFRNIYFGTVVASLALGPFISLQEPFLDRYVTFPTSFAGSLAALAAAIVVISIGVGLTVSLRFGVGPLDAMVLRLSEVTRIHYRYLRMVTDILFVVTGILMGAPFGVGTVVSAFAMGPTVAFFAKTYNRTLLRALGITDPRNEFRKAPKEAPSRGETQGEESASQATADAPREGDGGLCPQPPAERESGEAPSMPALGQ